jgi:hypothetical protein
MSLTYDTYVAQLSNLMVIPSTDANFQTFLPGCIDYSEQRIYRELNLINNQIRNTSGTLTANNRTFSLPTTTSGNFISVQDVNIVTPSSLTINTGGTRNQLSASGLEVIDFLYPNEQAQTTPSVPSLWAMIDQFTIAVGPSPDAAYQVEVIGTIRPTPLSSGNSSTFLTTYLPDLFIAASMIFAFGYQRDFGGQSDNPQSGAAWEAQYKLLLQSAAQEEIRKKYNTTFSAAYAPQQTSGGPV